MSLDQLERPVLEVTGGPSVASGEASPARVGAGTRPEVGRRHKGARPRAAPCLPSLGMTVEDTAAIALGLPEVTKDLRWGNRTWSVAGNGFVWERRFTKADVKRLQSEPVPEGPLLAVRVANLEEKGILMLEPPGGFFDIEHFRGYPAVLVRLEAASPRWSRPRSARHGMPVHRRKWRPPVHRVLIAGEADAAGSPARAAGLPSSRPAGPGLRVYRTSRRGLDCSSSTDPQSTSVVGSDQARQAQHDSTGWSRSAAAADRPGLPEARWRWSERPPAPPAGRGETPMRCVSRDLQ